MTDLDRPVLSLFRIGILIQHLNKNAEREMGLSLVQWCLLRQLVDLPGVSAHNLAKAVGVHPSTLTQTLKRLERKGHVFVTEDPKDSRRKLISITRVGHNTLSKIDLTIQDWANQLSELGSDLHRINVFLEGSHRENNGSL